MPEKLILNFSVTQPSAGAVPLDSAPFVNVLIHGMTSAHQTFLNVLGPIADATNRPVIAVDLRGHGKSPEPENLAEYDNTSCANDVMFTLTKAAGVSTDKTKFIVLGHSWGSRTALQFGVLFPAHTACVFVEDEYLRADTAERIKFRGAESLELVVKAAEQMQNRYMNKFSNEKAIQDWFVSVAGPPEFWGFPGNYDRKLGSAPAADGDENSKTFFPLFRPHCDLVWNHYCMHDDFSAVFADPAKYPFKIHVQCGGTSDADVSKEDYEKILAVSASIANPKLRSVSRIEGAGHVVHREKPDEFLNDFVTVTKEL